MCSFSCLFFQLVMFAQVIKALEAKLASPAEVCVCVCVFVTFAEFGAKQTQCQQKCLFLHISAEIYFPLCPNVCLSDHQESLLTSPLCVCMRACVSVLPSKLFSSTSISFFLQKKIKTNRTYCLLVFSVAATSAKTARERKTGRST